MALVPLVQAIRPARRGNAGGAPGRKDAKEDLVRSMNLWPALWLTLSLAVPAANQHDTTRRSLDQNTTIQGYPCAQGHAWFFQDGHLSRCTISREANFGEAQIPKGSIVELWPDGTTKYVMLAHAATVAGFLARGGGPLGPAEGSITSFYRSGKLRSLYLVDDQTIQGVPCRSGKWGIFTDPVNGGNFVEFYENGKLKSCKLTRDYGGQSRGHRLVLPK